MDKSIHISPRAISILMLEDSALDRDLSMARLEREGYSIDLHHAVGREDFVRYLENSVYDLILADYDVPGFNGMIALDMVRERDPQVPFIFISGVVGEEVAINSLHRGATDYVLKQRLDRLGPAVRRALNEANEHQTRLRAEATARASEERFRQLTNALTQLVWTLDADGNLNYANPAWRRVIQQDSHRWCDPRVVYPDDLAACEQAWTRAIREHTGFSLEARLRQNPTGDYHWYMIRAVTFGADTDAPRWLCTATDVQEQRTREEALRTAEKLAVTGRMAATIAHEINNPLESLTNLVFLLKQEPSLSAHGRKYVNMAEYELQRVSAITKQTLAFYRDTSTPSPIRVEDLAQDVMRLFTPRFRTKNISTEVMVESGCVIHATRGDLRQVLINLISNAIDAVPHGGSVRVRATTLSGSKPSMARVVVEDSGPGVPPENLERLFTPFFSTKGEHGTGLGLWVSKGIVEKYGGTITIGSRPQPEGANRTQVQITMPCEAIEQYKSEEIDGPTARTA